MTRFFLSPVLWVDTLKQGLTVLFRPRCPLCDRSATAIFCSACNRRLQSCKRANPVITQMEDPLLYGWGTYGGALKQGLAKLKYDHCAGVAEPFGQWLAELWLDHPRSPKPTWVVPIPLHRDREQQRGYNQADLIARSFCQVTGLMLRSRGLCRTRATTAQYALSRQDRYRNLSHAFSLGPDLEHASTKRAIVLVDDIFTTGATLRSATAVLQQAGFQVTVWLTVAVTDHTHPRQHPPSMGTNSGAPDKSKPVLHGFADG